LLRHLPSAVVTDIQGDHVA